MILYRRIKDAKIFVLYHICHLCLQLSVHIYIYLQVYKNNHTVLKGFIILNTYRLVYHIIEFVIKIKKCKLPL